MLKFYDVKWLLHLIDDNERPYQSDYDKSEVEDDEKPELDSLPSLHTSAEMPQTIKPLELAATLLEHEFNFTSAELEDILANAPVTQKSRAKEAVKVQDDQEEEEGGSFDLVGWM